MPAISRNRAVSQTIRPRLEQHLQSATGTARSLAAYMLANLAELPFQTSASIAAKVGVSESSVGRFCRALGYAHLKALKRDLQNDLGDAPWLVGDRLQAFRQGADDPQGSHSLQLQIAALVQVYEHTRSASWQAVAKRLAQRPRLYMAGFQTERSVAQYMVHLLQYLRDGVQLVDGSSDFFGDLLLGPAEERALVVFEIRRYSRHSQMLCQQARRQGIAVTLVTDLFCDWADACADEVFRIPTDFGLFWESSAAMSTWVQLMVNEVCRHLGADVERRLEATASLRTRFAGYSPHSAGSRQANHDDN